MNFPKRSLWIVAIAGLLLFVLVILTALIFRAGKNQSVPQESAREDSDTEEFTFFGLGPDSRLSDAVRERLDDELGRGSIERRTTIDLSTGYPGLLKQHFPQLHQLNQFFNYRPRERIEHRTVKLTYRYARRRNKPFDYVELVFFEDSMKPLFFKIVLKRDGMDVVEQIKAKYGQAQRISWPQKAGSSVYWRRAQSLLILSSSFDKLGNPKHHLNIYYLQNLQQLARLEEKERSQREAQRRRALEEAF